MGSPITSRHHLNQSKLQKGQRYSIFCHCPNLLESEFDCETDEHRRYLFGASRSPRSWASKSSFPQLRHPLATEKQYNNNVHTRDLYELRQGLMVGLF